jgi:hypothetical protein
MSHLNPAGRPRRIDQMLRHAPVLRRRLWL